MSETTKRDGVWLTLIERIQAGRDMQTADVAEDADVCKQTARMVLKIAEEAGMLRRESERAQIWRVDIGPLADVEDESYRRAISTLMEEAP